MTLTLFGILQTCSSQNAVKYEVSSSILMLQSWDTRTELTHTRMVTNNHHINFKKYLLHLCVCAKIISDKDKTECRKEVINDEYGIN